MFKGVNTPQTQELKLAGSKQMNHHELWGDEEETAWRQFPVLIVGVFKDR